MGNKFPIQIRCRPCRGLEKLSDRVPMAYTMGYVLPPHPGLKIQAAPFIIQAPPFIERDYVYPPIRKANVFPHDRSQSPSGLP